MTGCLAFCWSIGSDPPVGDLLLLPAPAVTAFPSLLPPHAISITNPIKDACVSKSSQNMNKIKNKKPPALQMHITQMLDTNN